MSKQILIIEDEPGIQDFLKACLEHAGYIVDLANEGVSGIAAFHKKIYDLILLDIMLPKMDGYTVCELIRQESNIPIIMLTALDKEQDQVKGFDVLADDYIVKPFSLPILLKRIEAALRKRSSPLGENESILKHGKVRLNQEAYEVYVGDRAVILTNIEYKLLQALLLNKGQVLTREKLLAMVWGDNFYDANEKLVNHHIMNLRRKLNYDCIETIRGVGYKIGKEDPE